MGVKERREREKSETRDKILDAARELFVTEGYEGVSMRRVAEKIEYSPTAIYVYFADKNELFHELCRQDFQHLQEAVATVHRRTVAVQTVQRFRLVLLLHEQPALGNDEAAKVVGLSARQVQRWRSRWAAGDFTIEDHPGRGRKAAFSPVG